MGLTDARDQALKCLAEGKVQHVARDLIDEKNLLKVGDVTAEQAAGLLKATKASQYRSEKHRTVADVTVHIFEPTFKLECDEKDYDWHIKFYFIEPDVYFISVHRRHVPKKPPQKKRLIRKVRIKFR